MHVVDLVETWFAVIETQKLRKAVPVKEVRRLCADVEGPVLLVQVCRGLDRR